MNQAQTETLLSEMGKELENLKKKVQHQGHIISVLNSELENHLIKRNYCIHTGK